MTRVIKGSLRYKSAPEVNHHLNVELSEKQKEIKNLDRNININEIDLFEQERQKSEIIRPSCKIVNIFNNVLTGSTNYTPFLNNLYYENFEQNASLSTPIYYGYPQFHEFEFFREDNTTPGYTAPPNEHIYFVSKSASTYNWGVYLSYAYLNDTTRNLRYIPEPSDPAAGGPPTFNWIVRNGIPFIIKNIVFQGDNLISFKCPMKHNLRVSEFVKLSFSFQGVDTYEVYSLGDGGSGSEDYVFNLYNYGYGINAPFTDGTNGTFKRVLDPSNANETTSKYYVRKHKILTYADEALINKCGFEGNIYNFVTQYETSGLTPDNQPKVVSKEGNQSVTVNFSRDIDISKYKDNQGRPITELFFTIVHRGYFGWFYGTRKIKQGWEFNLTPNPNAPVNTLQPDPWWSNANSDITNIVQNNYTKGGFTFYYNELLPTGFTMDGAICEWNDFDQTETVLSENYHKFTYNPGTGGNQVFNTFLAGGGGQQSNPFGFYYKPHYVLPIRAYSPYVETGNPQEVDLVPGYAYYSRRTDSFRWRDVYTFGYIDSDGIGFNYPYLNNSHYPYRNIIFRVMAEGRDYINIREISDPIFDNCE